MNDLDLEIYKLEEEIKILKKKKRISDLRKEKELLEGVMPYPIDKSFNMPLLFHEQERYLNAYRDHCADMARQSYIFFNGF